MSFAKNQTITAHGLLPWQLASSQWQALMSLYVMVSPISSPRSTFFPSTALPQPQLSQKF